MSSVVVCIVLLGLGLLLYRIPVKMGAFLTARRLGTGIHRNEVDHEFVLLNSPREFPTRLFPFVGALASVLIRLLAGGFSAPDLIVSAVCGAGLGWLVMRRRAENRKMFEKWKMERDLPNVVERIVMGVTAGLDVVPAMKIAAATSDECREADGITAIVLRALALHERGLAFAKSVEEACSSIDIPSVRHAFIHLGIAHQQGGELVRPLRELADATQLYFQERVEEEIAKLPVKATVPLLVTFTGLIIFFVTIPVMQVSSMTKKITESTMEGGQ